MLTKKYDFIKSKLRALLYEDYWNVGIVDDDITSFLKGGKPEVKWVSLTDKSEFIADPFAITNPENPEVVHIFCEIFSFNTLKGRIGFFSYNSGTGNFSQIQTIIQEDYHLSYPFLVTWGEEVFMIPESSANNAVSIYKATDYPTNWVKVKNLVDNYQGIDNTVLYLDGIWWLFSTDKGQGEHSYLNLFYTEDLLGKWKPHAKNPVKIDTRSSRSAGTPFMYKGAIIRPSMDCKKSYGEKITLNKIIKLTHNDFEEESISVLKPYKNEPYNDKIHTLSKAGSLTIVDGCKRKNVISSWPVFKCKIKRIRKKLGDIYSL